MNNKSCKSRRWTHTQKWKRCHAKRTEEAAWSKWLLPVWWWIVPLCIICEFGFLSASSLFCTSSSPSEAPELLQPQQPNKRRWSECLPLRQLKGEVDSRGGSSHSELFFPEVADGGGVLQPSANSGFYVPSYLPATGKHCLMGLKSMDGRGWDAVISWKCL